MLLAEIDGMLAATAEVQLEDQKANCHDLDWVKALLRGEHGALLRYEQEVVPYVAGALRRRGYDSSLIAEVQQSLRASLLVGSAEQPARLEQFQGRAPLKSWVTVCAVRSANKLRQSAARDDEAPDNFLEKLCSVDDPSMEQMKALYAAEFRIAFREAYGKLSSRDRMFFRMTVSEGMPLDQLGSLYDVHASTVCRWLERARGELRNNTRRALMKRFDADPFEIDSILQLIASRLDASLAATQAP